MSALRKNALFETSGFETESSKRSWEPTLYTIVHRPPAETRAVEARSAVSTAKNIALFLVAPFIGLAYVLAMPLVAAAMLAYVAGKTVCARFALVKHAAMIVAAPFIGLSFVLAAPLVGLGALGYLGTRAVAKR